MRTPFTDVLRDLQAGQADSLYYATTVQSACNLLRSRYFLSGQDMHVDPSDAHLRTGLPNPYGPVLLVLDPARIAKIFEGDVWVTRKPASEEAPRPAAEPEAQGNGLGPAKVVVFREVDDALPFSDCLSKIVLDDPVQENALGVQYYHLAAAALRRAMFSIRLDVAIERRHCPPRCACLKHYDEHKDRLIRLFDTTAVAQSREADKD